MRLSVASSLYYEVSSPATLLCSLRCVRRDEQAVLHESLVADRPVEMTELTVGAAGNRFTKIAVDEPGPLALQYLAVVQSRFQVIRASRIGGAGIRDLTAASIPYLFPSRYAPSDQMRQLAAELFGGIPTSYGQAVAVEDWLFRHLEYRIGASTEQSCADETYRTRAGVCRDFAHLGISFCRALTIPARYVTVYAYQLEPQDFHAVFEVFIDGTWYLIDGTRKAPLNGMARIAVGRDAGDTAVATLFGGIEGVGVQVSVAPAVGSHAEFMPITRGDLGQDELALSLI